ncbi:hypothetical protein ACHAWF_015732 [Thalassiosira exigua]
MTEALPLSPPVPPLARFRIISSLLLLSGLAVVGAFSTTRVRRDELRRLRLGREFGTVEPRPGRRRRWRSFAAPDDDDGNDANAGGEEEEDWRAFRAKLVMSEAGGGGGPSSTSAPAEGGDAADVAPSIVEDDSDLDGIGSLFSSSAAASPAEAFTPLSPSQWAYDSGDVIERGAVILGGVEQSFGFGLRQQYFHKSVILVLDHDENQFTRGIILNRPSERTIDDDVNEGVRWRVWFGGDVQGLDSLLPELVCLHSLRGEEARNASNPVMKDIQWTSFANAKKLVKKGVAAGPDDFWLFAGYAGWGPSQLSGELDRKSWYMCATDSGTLLKELAKQGRIADPRDAGLETWELLMRMIGRGDVAGERKGGFDDLMLKEFCRENLLRYDRSGREGDDEGVDVSAGTVDKLMREAAKIARSNDVSVGTLLRGSSADRSPFLLRKQELHHSLVLVTLEDDKASLGCMLNHPATKGYEVGSTTVPIRYGGDYAVKGQSPLMFLHCSEMLRVKGLGEPLGDEGKGIYKCTQEEATQAVSYNVAKPESEWACQTVHVAFFDQHPFNYVLELFCAMKTS